MGVSRIPWLYELEAPPVLALIFVSNRIIYPSQSKISHESGQDVSGYKLFKLT
jgi:hypothetical protein